MAHDLSIREDGTVEMAYAGDTPWHNLGTPVGDLQSAQDMIRLANLDWTVGTGPIFFNGNEIPDFRAIVRNDTMKVLGIGTNRYVPLQNAQAAEVMDALVTEGGAHVEVAGALKGGRIAWMLARLPNDIEVVSGDAVVMYMLLAWGHDGKHGLAGKLTGTRVVCKNTLAAAGFGGGQKWSKSASIYFRHTGEMKIRIADAQAALGLAKKQTEETAEAYRLLAAKHLTGPAVTDYFTTVFPGPFGKDDDVLSDEYQEKLSRWNEHQDKLLALFEGGRGTEIPGVRGTAWGAYNAVTEWITHDYPVLKTGKVSLARQESAAFGSYSEIRDRALEVALADQTK